MKDLAAFCCVMLVVGFGFWLVGFIAAAALGWNAGDLYGAIARVAVAVVAWLVADRVVYQ